MTTPPEAADARLIDGRYRLGARLGGGAVADVFRGVDERLARPVAVKVFRGDAAEQLQRHEAEMRTLAALDHPSLVTVFDAGNDDVTGNPYLVMQLIEGHTLADELHDGPLPLDRTARYGAALADALAYVHERGLVHRDVKPANVLIAADGRVHLADFGIARLVDAAHQTRTGDVLGTPAYFAPEQVAGEAVGAPTDVYALGLVLFECLTGGRPYEGTAMEVAMARVTRSPDIPADLPESWRSLVAAMTSRAPVDRPTTSQVAETLRSLGAGGGVDATVRLAPPAAPRDDPAATRAMPLAQTVPPAEPPEPARRRVTPAAVIVVLALVAAIVAGVVVATRHNGSSTGTHVQHGKPTLPQPLERDVRRLENLVQR